MNLLDHGWIELQEMMGDDNSIVAAARTSVLGESKGLEKDRELIHYLLQHHHTSPFEHVIFKFRVRCPVVVAWQWVRHRTWSFNFESGRYHPLKDEMYVPDEWHLQSQTNHQGSLGILDLPYSAYFTEALEKHYQISYDLYKAALEQGIAREQARLFLPGFAMYYTFVGTVDAHNLMNFIKLRISEEAQYEIRVYAEAIYKIFKEKLPITAEAFEKYVLV